MLIHKTLLHCTYYKMKKCSKINAKIVPAVTVPIYLTRSYAASDFLKICVGLIS